MDTKVKEFNNMYYKVNRARKLLVQVEKTIRFDNDLDKEIINSIDSLDLILYNLNILKWKEEVKQEKVNN